MKETRKKYTAEYKISSVTLSVQYGSIFHVAQELGISKYNLQHWKKLVKKISLPCKKHLVQITKVMNCQGYKRKIKISRLS